MKYISPLADKNKIPSIREVALLIYAKYFNLCIRECGRKISEYTRESYWRIDFTLDDGCAVPENHFRLISNTLILKYECSTIRRS